MIQCSMFTDSAHQLKGAEAISQYVMGGKGVVTLKSPSKVHKSYFFSKPRNASNFKPDDRFIYVLDAHNEWVYVGMLSDDVMRWTKHSAYPLESPEFKGARYVVKMMHRDIETPMELYHEGVCPICGKRLTNPKSIVEGIGPKCKQEQYDLRNKFRTGGTTI